MKGDHKFRILALREGAIAEDFSLVVASAQRSQTRQ